MRLRVVVADEMQTHAGAFPFGVELCGDRIHTLLISTRVADEDDLLESAAAQRARGQLEQGTEPLLGKRDRSRLRHDQRGRQDPDNPPGNHKIQDEREQPQAHGIFSVHRCSLSVLAGSDVHEGPAFLAEGFHLVGDLVIRLGRWRIGIEHDRNPPEGLYKFLNIMGMNASLYTILSEAFKE